MGLTDAGEGEEDHEGVDDGDDGGGERRDDLAEGAEAAEEAQHAQRAHHAHHARVVVGDNERQDGHADDKDVEPGPGVGEEGDEPERVGVDGQLQGEDDGEGEVEAVQQRAQTRAGPVGVDERAAVLCLHDGAQEALKRERSGQHMKHRT